MGASASAAEAPPAISRSRAASLNSRVKTALMKLGERVSHTPPSFDRILLNFPAIERTFGGLREAFRDFDANGDGTLSYGDLSAMMKRLGAVELDEASKRHIFDEADVYHEGKLNFSEFVVALCVGYVLNVIPLLDDDDAAAAAAAAAAGDEEEGKRAAATTEGKMVPPPRMKRSASHFYGKGEDVKKAFEFAVDMYLMFDPESTGVISRETMQGTILALQQNSPSKGMRRRLKEEGRRPSGGHAGMLLASSRWEELDWDKEGYCSFEHFILAFVQWVTVRHAQEDEE